MDGEDERADRLIAAWQGKSDMAKSRFSDKKKVAIE